MRSLHKPYSLLPPDPALRAELATGLDSARSPRTDQLAAFLASACGNTAVALVHYGSHAQDSDARPESAHDFFVIVDRYRDAYHSLSSRGVARFRPRVATVLHRNGNNARRRSCGSSRQNWRLRSAGLAQIARISLFCASSTES